ncbi:MAG: metallophosphoesterase [Rhodospirillales bacterium]|nr:metallophosphoesterase [Rhodospirillales bacterium]
MIIAQISDTHIDPDSPNAAERVRDLQRCVDDINRLDPAPDVVIHTGDLVHNGNAAKYQVAARILGALKRPLHVAAGNRDDRAAIRSIFAAGRDLLPGTPFVQYSVDAYPVRLIALDTLSDISNMGEFCDIRADSLRAALAEGGARPTAVFMHHPPFEVAESKYRWQFDSQEGIDRMRRALEGQSHVMRAFCGHAHRIAVGKIAGVPVSSTPSVAIDLRLGDFPDGVQSAPLYQIHRLDARGGFTSELRAAL